MALKIQLRKDQKIIINGAVLENASGGNIAFLVLNEASILRDDDILMAEDVKTPASRVYYALQCMYLFPGERDRHLRHFKEFLDSYEDAAPSSGPIATKLRGFVDEGKLYKALKHARELVLHEREVLADVQKQLGEELRDEPAGGKSSGDRGVGADSGRTEDQERPGDE
jgi:flagellar protein FlbT